MGLDIEKLRELPRKSSEDYLELMHLALKMNDREWFEELAKEKARLEKLEEEARRELGWTGTN
jgi:hypothetical protein